MKKHAYQPIDTSSAVSRRDFVKTVGVCSAAAGSIVLGVPSAAQAPAPPPETNIDDFMKVPKGKHALPGPFPGRVVEVKDPRSLVDDKLDARVVADMFAKGVRTLTGKDLKESYALFFEPG
ncbi:MAG: twin-arginine translocation signal domain-containing protein, partial [Acidobacteria bacterium]|nr:twin-arginine translocation signal domain-containing protein [Acidobacteriota bacterium]